MPDPERTSRLSLPRMLPDQAQKHVTHNEALIRLDAMVQLSVAGFGALVPPGAPAEGAVYALGAAPTGAWAGEGGSLALWSGTGWLFAAPATGWLAHDATSGELRHWQAGDWQPLFHGLDMLGIATTADAVNRLAVASAASLFTHAGAGHQLKVNKAAPAETASLLFQSGFSGRAEMGLAGSDDLSLKVSADGSAWTEALRVARTSGRAQLPAGLSVSDGTASAPALAFAADPDTGLYSAGANVLGVAAGGVQRGLLSTTGLQLDVLLTGTAVMQSDTDTTSGRLMKVGAGGWAKAQGAYPPEYDFDTWGVSPSGAYWFNNAADAGPEGLNYGVVLAMNYAASRQMRLAMNTDASKAWIGYIDNASVQSPWSMLYGQRSILGTVSQTGGVPAGALIERGSNANGGFTRWADGTQLCWRTMGALTGGGQTWTFPAVFAAAPVLVGSAQSTVLSCFCLDVAPTTTTTTFSARDKTDARRADTCHLTAIGRWF